MSNQDLPTCPRHPDQVAYVRCQRCGRPTCHRCQRPAAVGIQCVDCVKQDRQGARRQVTVLGGRPAPGRPIVTISIIVICVLIWLGQRADSRVTGDLLFSPLLGEQQPWRFLTAAFVHEPNTIFHIGFDMFALWVCGQFLEPVLGRARFLALYLICALGGSVGDLLLAGTPAYPGDFHSGWTTGTIGASGAVFGLFLAMLILNHKLGLQTGGVVALIVINGILSFVLPNIAWQVHVGGAATGAICGGLLMWLGRERRNWHWPALLAVLPLLAALAAWRYSTVTLPPGF